MMEGITRRGASPLLMLSSVLLKALHALFNASIISRAHAGSCGGKLRYRSSPK
jgi:hypothetical protein